MAGDVALHTANSLAYVEGNPIEFSFSFSSISVRLDWMLVAGDLALHTANCEAAGGGMNYVNGNPIDIQLTQSAWFGWMLVAGDIQAHIAQSILPGHVASIAVGLSNSTVIRTSTQGKAQNQRCNRCFQTGHKTSTCESPCAWDAANGVCSAAVGAHHKSECGHHRIVCADPPVNRNAFSRNAKKQIKADTQRDSCLIAFVA